MIHHAARGIHHGTRHVHKLLNHIGGYYLRNPHKALDHGFTAATYGVEASEVVGRAAINGGVHVSKLAWRHGPTVAKHSAKFMTRVAIKGFRLFT